MIPPSPRAVLPTVFALLFLASACASTAAPTSSAPGSADAVAGRSMRDSAALALREAMSDLDVESNDARVLLLTNAGYSRADDRGTEFFADVATEVTGCSVGKRSLYFLHTPATEALWFALFRRDDRRLSFRRWAGDGFESRLLVADPGLPDRPDDWQRENSGPVEGRLFSVLSFSHAWAQGADPLLLKCAEFHNHCCGGVTSGYLAGRYIREHLPLRRGEDYVFVTATPSCAMDALQVMFDATTGKKGMFSTLAAPGDVSEFAVDGVRPLTLVMRVDDTADTCDGLLLGFAWPRTGQTGKLRNLADLANLDGVRVLKRFSGPASLARSSSLTGLNPYEVIGNE